MSNPLGTNDQGRSDSNESRHGEPKEKTLLGGAAPVYIDNSTERTGAEALGKIGRQEILLKEKCHAQVHTMYMVMMPLPNHYPDLALRQGCLTAAPTQI